MKEQCDEILKQYGISRCTDFSFPLKSKHPVSMKPPTHPNPNVGILDDPLTKYTHSHLETLTDRWTPAQPTNRSKKYSQEYYS